MHRAVCLFTSQLSLVLNKRGQIKAMQIANSKLIDQNNEHKIEKLTLNKS